MSKVGKPGRLQMVRLAFQNHEAVNSILRNAKKLKNDPDFGSVYLRRETTFSQRQKYYKLKQELKVRSDAGENVAIKNGKIVVRDNQGSS